MTFGAIAAVAGACGGHESGRDAAVPRIESGVGIRIIKGVASDLSQESVIRLDQFGEFACTGTLVAPNLVLTARHCVQEIGGSTECGSFVTNEPVTTLSVSMGITAKPTGISGKQMFVEKSTDACTTDLALVLLDADIPGAKISKLRFAPAKIGEPAVTVGYGDDGSGQPSSKRAQRAGLAVDGVGPALFQYKAKTDGPIPVDLAVGELVTGESTCSGDSGGPLFDGKGEIIAVTSRGVDDSCLDRPSIYSTVAAHEALIRAAFTASGHSIDDPLQPTEPSAVDAGVVEAPAPASPPPTPAPQASATVEATTSEGCSLAAAPTRASSNTPPLAFALVAATALLSSRRRRAPR